ncbi:MAG: thioredoxin [Luteitalea sp.]|nr:thioredoxin [Luteitalea sp.]
MYPDARVVRLIDERFVPVRAHVREQADLFKKLGARYSANWTPTTLVVDPQGEERHRIEGFLPTDDFVAQLDLGLAHSSFGRGEFAEATREFGAVVDAHPGTDAAPEALYWMGVSRYKATNDATALADTAGAFRDRYQESTWAKKASVWGKS